MNEKYYYCVLQITLSAFAAEINNQNFLDLFDNIKAMELCAKIFINQFIGSTSAIRITLFIYMIHVLELISRFNIMNSLVCPSFIQWYVI